MGEIDERTMRLMASSTAGVNVPFWLLGRKSVLQCPFFIIERKGQDNVHLDCPQWPPGVSENLAQEFIAASNMELELF